MRQPKRTASRLLSALLGLIMLLSLLPTVALAAERVPEEIKAMEIASGVKDEVNFRDLVWNPPFREIHDKPVKFNGERRWVRWNETANKWESYTERTFKEGKYKYFVEATITGQYYEQYQFASQVAVTVDGEKWTTTGSAIDPGRKLSRIMMISPEYTVTNDRELVNRVALTSDVERTLVDGKTLFEMYFDVQSASTTTGTDVSSSVKIPLSEGYWQVRYPGQTEWTRAWDPAGDDDRPLVQGGAYYRYYFHVELRGKLVFVDTDKLKVTLDGTACSSIGDTLDDARRYGREIYAYSREYYAPKKSELRTITSIDLKTSIPNMLLAYNPIEKPTITETNNKMVFKADSDKDGWQHGVARALPGNILQYTWEEPTTTYFKKNNVYRYGAVLTVKDWEHWKLGAASNLTVTVDGERIPSENIERLDNYRLFVYSEKHQAHERTPIEEVNVTSNIASIVKLGGTVQTPTITFNDGGPALYIDDSIGFGWLRWEDSDWYTYAKGEFEPGKYCYYTNIHVENWEDYAFSDDVTVNWDGEPCDRPTGRAPSQIFVSSPVYIIPETVELVTATSSDINSIPKVGGAMTTPTFTVQTGQPARFREDYPYCAWFKKVDGAWKECGLHVDMDKIFTEGTYRYCVYLFIGGKGHTEDRESYVFSPDSKVIVNGTMWETWSYKVTDTFSWLRLFSPEYTISAAPAAPVVTAGNSAVSGKPMLTWDAVDGATSYRVYRATSQNGPYRLLGSVTTTTYVNTGAKDGVTYYYMVTAINDSGESAFSNTVSGQNKAVTSKPAAPVVKIGNSATSGKPMLTWNAVSGAASYKVYRATTKNGAYSVINTTKALTYTNTGAALGTTYYYKVEALDASGKSMGFSDVAEGKVAPVLAVGYSSVSGKPQLTWKAVPGATEYQVYRSTQQNSGYTKINTTTATSYVNTGAKAGTTYYYKIVAVKGTAVSDFSNIVSARPSK